MLPCRPAGPSTLMGRTECTSTGVSSWTHPMDEVYRELIQLIRRLDPESAEQRARAVQDHLSEVYQRSVAQLSSWTGPFSSEDGEYFFNEATQLSTWVNPIQECEAEMSIRQAVLYRSLLQVPSETESMYSARSFYTACGDSPRSPRSTSPRRKAPSPLSEPQKEEINLDDTRTTATSKGSPKTETQAVKVEERTLAREQSDDMDITFGCSLPSLAAQQEELPSEKAKLVEEPVQAASASALSSCEPEVSLSQPDTV